MWARHHPRVGNASLACTRTRSRSVLACDIACDASRSHSFFKLHLGDTVALTETWLPEKIYNSEILPSGYSLYRSDRGKRGGGVMICVRAANDYVSAS